MTDREDETHYIQIGRATMATEVLSLIEVGEQERFSEGEILDAIEAHSKQVVEEYAELVEEMGGDVDEEGWVQ